MPKLKPEEVEQRRQEIIGAARRCFLRRGFHQATTDEICREAAITPGGLYHYFRSKKDVIKAVVQDSADQAVAEVTSIAQMSPGPRSALQRLGALLAQTVQSPEFLDNARLDVEIWSESLRSEDLSTILATGRAALHDALAEIIHDAVRTGEYNDTVGPGGLSRPPDEPQYRSRGEQTARATKHQPAIGHGRPRSPHPRRIARFQYS